MDGTLSEIRGFAGFFGRYAPLHWAYCDGDVLRIDENPALFSLLGDTFGGDGRITFALPDLRGRVLIHRGVNPYTSTEWVPGVIGGIEAVQLKVSEIPSHTHTAKTQGGSGSLTGSATAKMFVNNGASDVQEPSDKFIGVAEGGNDFANSNDGSTLNAGAIEVDTSGLKVNVKGIKVGVGDTGGNEPHLNMQPYLVISWIICVEGDYPIRS